MIFGFALQFAKAWTEPTDSAPRGNVEAPINTSNTNQSKNGIFGATGLWSSGSISATGSVKGESGLCIGNDCRTAWPSGGQWTTSGSNIYYNSGNVGIGTASPGAKLEVAGQVKITGGSPANGKVLTSDASGLASWQPSATGTTLPSCTTGQYIRKTDTGWECVDSAWGPTGSYHYFITAMKYTGSMGGPSGMNSKCNSDANRIAGKTYAAVTTEIWGVLGANYYGVFGNGKNGTDHYSTRPPVGDIVVWNEGDNSCLGWTSSSDDSYTAQAKMADVSHRNYYDDYLIISWLADQQNQNISHQH